MEITGSYNALTQLLTLTSGDATSSGGASSGSTTTTTTSSSDSDTTSWSSLAQSLAQSDGTSSFLSPVLQLKAQNQVIQQHLVSALATKFEEAGIDVGQSITLSRDAEGNVTVEGDNADADTIEQIFKDTPVLTEAFNALADNSKLEKSLSGSQSASLVRTNGYAAYVQALGDDSSSGDFYLNILGQKATSYFG